MTQFHEGQQVEVNQWANARSGWRKATIVKQNDLWLPKHKYTGWVVEFLDGAMQGQRAVFDTDHIRAYPSIETENFKAWWEESIGE